jgi:hypothetical protein
MVNGYLISFVNDLNYINIVDAIGKRYIITKKVNTWFVDQFLLGLI